MRALLAAAVLLLAATAAASAADAKRDEALERRREGVAQEILRLGAAIRREVVAGDATALLAHVPAEGLRCGDRVVPRARVERDLRTKGAWLHEVYFGEGGPAAGGPRSLRALLRTAPDVAMVVGFRVDPAAAPVGRPCLDFRAKGLATPGTPLCFERRGGKWWLVDSLYPCG